MSSRARSRVGPPPNIGQQRLSTSGAGGSGFGGLGVGRGVSGIVGATTVTSVTAVSSSPEGGFLVA